MIRYLLRRARTSIVYGRLVCASPRCGRPRVGIAAWCRGHTDAVLYGPASDWPTSDRETPMYFPTQDERRKKWATR